MGHFLCFCFSYVLSFIFLIWFCWFFLFGDLGKVNGGGIINMRNSKNGDPEPGRCKRTDGKKWRCSKDVAPNQKYCERHLHRGRPRSRKPVEVKNNSSFNTNVQATSAASNQFLASKETSLLYYPKTDLNISTASCKEPNRLVFEWRPALLNLFGVSYAFLDRI